MSSPGLSDEVLARGGVRDAVSDPAWLRAFLDAEAGLAWAQAAVGLISPDDARSVVDACKPDRFDLAELSKAAAESGNPVVALVSRLRELTPTVHKGATSQDILDTASMLVADRALGPLLADLTGAAESAANLARAATPVGAARWLSALHQTIGLLTNVRETRLAVQLGGSVGASDLTEAYAATLGLVAPGMPWHTDRTRIGELAGALGIAAGTAGKIARDVTLLGQNEVAAVSALACASHAPGLVATLLAAMTQEHEWACEWRALRELLVSVGSAAAWLHTCLSGLTSPNGRPDER